MRLEVQLESLSTLKEALTKNLKGRVANKRQPGLFLKYSQI